jgi:HD superfamily phosphohydrolase YqeK
MQVAVHTTSGRGFSPEEIAERYADKIIHVADSADPVIQQQARAFRNKLVYVLESALKEAVQSDRTTVYNALNDAGQPQLADLIRRL